MRFACGLIVLAACDRVFGLAPVPDAPAAYVTGHRIERTAQLAGGTIAVGDAPFAPGRVALATVLDDGSTASIDYDGTTGAFQFPVATLGARYRLQYVVDGRARELQHSAEHLELMEPSVGRPGRVPVKMSTKVHFIPDVAPSLDKVITVGVWSDSIVPNDTRTVDWLMNGSLFGPPSLVDTAAGDRAFYDQHGSTTSVEGKPMFAILRSGEITPFVLADGASPDVTVSVPARAANRCFHLTVARDAEARRVQMAYPDFTAGFSQSWHIDALPSTDLGSVGGSTVASEVVQSAAASAVDVTPRFYVPFPEPLVAISTVGISRDMTLPGAQSSARLTVLEVDTARAPDDASCTNTLDLPTSVALVGTITIAGTPMTRDAVDVTFDRDQLVPVTWDIAPGDVDLYQVTLFEVTKGFVGATSISTVRVFETVDQMLAIDPTLLVHDHYYILGFGSVSAYPGAREGDFAHLAERGSLALSWSVLFHVAS